MKNAGESRTNPSRLPWLTEGKNEFGFEHAPFQGFTDVHFYRQVCGSEEKIEGKITIWESSAYKW